tara:strand:+ start:54 stop:599 length:546 start_codon:yes stop_codon:yes gene_type:complete
MVDIQQNKIMEAEQEGINPFNNPTPGESLTKNPDERFEWEQQAKFTDVDEAIKDIFLRITERDALIEMLNFFKNKQPIEEMTQMILYRGFTKGEYNVDLMLLLVEPLMYLLIAICEEYDIEPTLYDDEDVDGAFVSEDSLDDVDSKNLTRQVSDIRKDSVPPSLLARVKELPEEEELEGDN